MLQFDVMQYRLEHEYGAPIRFERIPYRHPRWVTGPEREIDRVASGRGRMRIYDSKGKPLILFDDEWNLRWALQNETSLTFHDVAP
jgi:peptide chain release factor 3